MITSRTFVYIITSAFVTTERVTRIACTCVWTNIIIADMTFLSWNYYFLKYRILLFQSFPAIMRVSIALIYVQAGFTRISSTTIACVGSSGVTTLRVLRTIVSFVITFIYIVTSTVVFTKKVSSITCTIIRTIIVIAYLTFLIENCLRVLLTSLLTFLCNFNLACKNAS